MKRLILPFSLCSVLFLAGCPASEFFSDLLDSDIRPWRNCVGIFDGDDNEIRRDCTLGAEYKKDISPIWPFDLLNMTIDLSDSTVTVLDTTGYGTVTVNRSDGSYHTTSFSWQKFGDLVQLSNPTTLESWLSGLPTTIVELDAEISGMEVSSGSGSNTFSAEIKYGGTPFTGVAQSWYNSSPDCSDMYPNHQLCF